MPFDEGSSEGGGGGRPYSSQDMVNVLYFLRQAEIEGEMWQGIMAGDAFDSACRIMELPPVETREALGLKYEVGSADGHH